MSFIDKLNSSHDIYDVNTVGGLLNRLYKLTDEQSMADKYNFEPEQDPISHTFFKKQSEKFWDNTEIKFSQDIDDYKNVDPRLREALNKVLGFFAGGDGIVTSNLAFRFLFEAKSMVELSALLYQAIQETIHAENYITTIKTLVPNEEERKKILSYADTLECVAKKSQLMEKYKNANIPKSYRYLAYAATEGIFFWASFSFLFWFRRQLNDRGEMLFKIIVTSNTQIAGDESLHRDFGAARYRALPPNERLPQSEVFELLKEFCEIEFDFADAIMPEPYQDLNNDCLKRFVKFMADQLCTGLGYEKMYGMEKIPEDMPWMLADIFCSKVNFYEVDSHAYKQHIISNDNDEDKENIQDVDEIDF